MLLRARPPLLPVLPSAEGEAGVPGVVTPGLLRSLELRDDKEPFRRTPPAPFRRLSAPALAVEADLPIAAAFGVLIDGGPLLTSSLVF